MTSEKTISLATLMQKTKIGETFFTEASASTVQTYATRYHMKVQTENGKVTFARSNEAVNVTRVTVLQEYRKIG